jgi:hypothetical protein
MPYYRLYCVDKNGRFYRCEDFNADSDQLAIERAVEMRGADAAELWQQARMVCSFSVDHVEEVEQTQLRA